MTEMEMNRLKEQIKAEVKAEVVAELGKGKVYTVWNEVREYTEAKLKGIGKFDNREVCSFINGVSAIIKPVCQIKKVAMMNIEQAEKARNIVDKIFEYVEEVRS